MERRRLAGQNNKKMKTDASRVLAFQKYTEACMFFRALLAFLILPCVVAGLIPIILACLDPWRGHGFLFPGIPVAGLGLLVLLWCVRDFYVSGKGTLAPWDPPKNLVTTGLYCYSRNPMYVGVLTLICGWALLSGSPLLACYMVLFSVIFHLRVVHYEEPWLSKKFGAEWTAYCNKTQRWLPHPANPKHETRNTR